MALLNNLYIHVVDENVSNNIESTSHPTEQGIEITDTVKVKPVTISLSGMIVDYGDMKASAILSKIIQLQKDGSLIDYSGRNVASNMQIQTFSHAHPYTIHGGMSFSMELKEVRIAKSSYDASKQKKAESEENKTNPKMFVGGTVIFKGGPVYVSSDAKKAAATRGRSVCKVYKISTASWSIHQYCLISTDGGKVYGWVDKSNIEGISSSSTNTSSKKSKQFTAVAFDDGGQKIESASYTVKQGDTLYSLVPSLGALLGMTIADRAAAIKNIMAANPSAFSEKGNASTLQAGANLKVKATFFTEG